MLNLADLQGFEPQISSSAEYILSTGLFQICSKNNFAIMQATQQYTEKCLFDDVTSSKKKHFSVNCCVACIIAKLYLLQI